MILKRKNLYKIIKLLLFLVIGLLVFLICDNWVSAESLPTNISDYLGSEVYLHTPEFVIPVSSTNGISEFVTYKDSSERINQSYNTLYGTNSADNINSTTSYTNGLFSGRFNGRDITFGASTLTTSSSTSYFRLGLKRIDSIYSEFNIGITFINEGSCIVNAVDTSKNISVYPTLGQYFYDGSTSKPDLIINTDGFSGSIYSYDSEQDLCISYVVFHFKNYKSSQNYIYSRYINLPLQFYNPLTKNYVNQSSKPFFITYASIYTPNMGTGALMRIIDSYGLKNTPIEQDSSGIIQSGSNDTPYDELLTDYNINKLFSIKPLDNGIISSFVSIPLKLLNKLYQAFNSDSVCSDISFGNLELGSKEINISLPCYDLQNIFPSVFFNIIDLIFCFSILYALSHRIIKLFYNVSSLDDEESSKGGI